MKLERKYCARCGKAVQTRVLDDRPRVVCPACETVFYDNPLPVAASVVLNERREVLLVKRKREPYQGAWCLPMGFAELGETVREAALRELREEAGIDGAVVHLLDADSFESELYGDLLIVTFEMERTGGEECAGDDAEEVGYFPLEEHPALPFSSNEKALRACAAAHRDGWAIQDSFVTLQSEADQAMASDALVTLVEERAWDVARLWLADVRSNPTTPSYRTLDQDALLARATLAVSQLGRWLRGDEPTDGLKVFYPALARERQAQGFRACEVLSSLTLLKKHIWEFARSQGIWERPIDVYRVLELNRRVATFFDKAIYHTMRAFEATGP